MVEGEKQEGPRTVRTAQPVKSKREFRMSSGPPSLIAINHDDYHAKHVGRTKDGRQFFLTGPFIPGGDEFVALFLFDASGVLLEARIDNFGPRATVDEQAWRAAYQQRLRELGRVRFGRIEVAPFSVERFGTTFGLIVSEPEDEADTWWVELHPGNYMAFHAPWESGYYDT
jgi:hypothetical protein